MSGARLAEPLMIIKERNLVRFRSCLNGRIFSLAFSWGMYEFVELDMDIRKPFVLDVFYYGRDADEVKRLILKEVMNVQ